MAKYSVGIPAGMEDDSDDDIKIRNTTRIRVVPDMSTGVGLNGQNFDVQLDIEDARWIQNFLKVWTQHKSIPPSENSLKNKLMKSDDPLLLALKFYAASQGCRSLNNKTIGYYILETVCELHNRRPEISKTCDDNMRMVAFNFTKECSFISICNAVVRSYELRKIADLLVPQIRKMLDVEEHVKNAAYWAMYLGVTNAFDTSEIILPLILLEKSNILDEYLKTAKDQQLSSVIFLDSLLDNSKNDISDILVKYNYPRINTKLLDYRCLKKLVRRLVKKFNIDEQYTPNLTVGTILSYLSHLYYKYQDGAINLESFRELAYESAQTKELQMHLVEKFLCSDIDEAAHIVSHFNIPLGDCPLILREYFKNMKKSDNGKVESKLSKNGGVKNSNNKKYLQLELPDDCVILVDDNDKFLDMVNHLERHSVIGIDCEWKPNLRASLDVAALLQVASDDRIFLIDCLSEEINKETWGLLGSRIFDNVELLKIGFQMDQDLRLLQKSVPLQFSLKTRSCYLDLRDLWLKLKVLDVLRFPFENSSTRESLGDLTEVCLGKRLDKSNQCSNWAQRPLRADQITYAALDVHCLLQIFKVFTDLVHRSGFDINKVVEEISTGKTGYLVYMKRTFGQQRNENYLVPVENCVYENSKRNNRRSKKCVADVKFICDTDLKHLCKEFRKLGFDTILATLSDLNYYADLACSENRIVVVHNKIYKKLIQVLPKKQYLNIPEKLYSSVEKILWILKQLKLVVYDLDLFTRCVFCNSNAFILVTTEEMQRMLNGRVSVKMNQIEFNAEKKLLLKKKLKIVALNQQMINSKKTKRGELMKLDSLNKDILKTNNYFLICDNCGNCTYTSDQTLNEKIQSVVHASSIEQKQRKISCS